MKSKRAVTYRIAAKALFYLIYLSIGFNTGLEVLHPANRESSPVPVRTLEMKLVIDQSLPTPETTAVIETLLARISRDFETQFGLRFVVTKRQSWKNAAPQKTVDRLIHLFYTAVPTEGTDIVIGIVKPPKRRGRDGMSFYEEGYILVRYLENQKRLEKVIKHEIAHLFGATHVDDETALMDSSVSGSGLNGANKAIIGLHRDRKFKEAGFPISIVACNRLLPLYRKIAKENETLKRSGLPFLKRKSLKSRLGSKKIHVARADELRHAYRGLENVYTYLAMINNHLGNYEATLTACGKALKIKPGQYGIYNFMGIAARRKGDFNRAIQCYRKVIQLNPHNHRVYYNLGIAYEKQGDEEKALQSYRRVLQYNPRFSDAYNNIGCIYLKKNDVKRAIPEFKKALQMNPHHEKAAANLKKALNIAKRTIKTTESR